MVDNHSLLPTSSNPSLFPGIVYDMTKLNELRPRVRVGADHPWSKVPNELKLHCFVCGVPFYRRKSNYRNFSSESGKTDGMFFCNQSCAAAYRRVVGISPGRQKRDLHRFCTQCHEKFSKPNVAQLRGIPSTKECKWRPHNDRMFCSKKCSGKWFGENELPSKRHTRIRNALESARNAHSEKLNMAFRSGWEVAYAEWLDRQGIRFQYEPETFNTPHGKYTPDFYLPDYDEWVEVKGFKSDRNPTQPLKMKWFGERHRLSIIDSLGGRNDWPPFDSY